MAVDKGTSSDRVDRSEAQWRERLTPEQFHILRNRGTERAFTGAYYQHEERGTYLCAGCGQRLFGSDAKFESGSGWPSFYQPAGERTVEELTDHGHGMVRTEVTCGRCGGHLGHVFDDGPRPTGRRYCINSAALAFEKDSEG